MPNRPLDRYTARVAEWRGGCVYCGEPDTGRALPESDDKVFMPLCARHTRWAMASRRERMGKQSGALKRLLLAWCKSRNIDEAPAREWLGY